jgi:E3 ubiquitin-protein ligase UBR1
MIIKKCSLLFLCKKNGSFFSSPYLDIHGEVDLGLKRGKPQFLNLKRYQEFRKVWLNHGIPSLVARKMEQAFDGGGWTTF